MDRIEARRALTRRKPLKRGAERQPAYSTFLRERLQHVEVLLPSVALDPLRWRPGQRVWFSVHRDLRRGKALVISQRPRGRLDGRRRSAQLRRGSTRAAWALARRRAL